MDNKYRLVEEKVRIHDGREFLITPEDFRVSYKWTEGHLEAVYCHKRSKDEESFEVFIKEAVYLQEKDVDLIVYVPIMVTEDRIANLLLAMEGMGDVNRLNTYLVRFGMVGKTGKATYFPLKQALQKDPDRIDKKRDIPQYMLDVKLRGIQRHYKEVYEQMASPPPETVVMKAVVIPKKGAVSRLIQRITIGLRA